MMNNMDLVKVNNATSMYIKITKITKNYLTHWSNQWKMSVNIDKCGIVHFRKINRSQTCYF